MKRWTWLWVILGLLVSGCGGSVDNVVLTGASQPEQIRLQGTWGGYFPGSNISKPDSGIEIHFDRASRNAYLHRSSPHHSTRSTVKVERQGSQVVLRFPTSHGDDSEFRGTFVGPDTLRGRYTNPQRNEDFAMDLVSVGSAFPETLIVPAFKSTLGEQFKDTLLVIDALDQQGTGYEFGFGLGYYYSPGRGVVWGNLPPGADQSLVTANVDVPTSVIQMAFFPEWISFDIYNDVNQLEYLATFEVRMADFAAINPTDPNVSTPIEVYKSSQIGVFPEDVSVARCTMRYISSYDRNNPRFGNHPLGTQGEVRIQNKTYRVPRAVAALLEGFSGVERLPDPPAGPTPVASIAYFNQSPPNKVAFDSSGSSDPSGGPLTYFWDFDDGGSSSTEPNPTHLFGPGVHKVRLTVTTTKGVTASATVTLGF